MFRICKTDKGFAIFAKYQNGKIEQISVEYADKQKAIKALCAFLHRDALA